MTIFFFIDDEWDDYVSRCEIRSFEIASSRFLIRKCGFYRLFTNWNFSRGYRFIRTSKKIIGFFSITNRTAQTFEFEYLDNFNGRLECLFRYSFNWSTQYCKTNIDFFVTTIDNRSHETDIIYPNNSRDFLMPMS